MSPEKDWLEVLVLEQDINIKEEEAQKQLLIEESKKLTERAVKLIKLASEADKIVNPLFDELNTKLNLKGEITKPVSYINFPLKDQEVPEYLGKGNPQWRFSWKPKYNEEMTIKIEVTEEDNNPIFQVLMPLEPDMLKTTTLDSEELKPLIIQAYRNPFTRKIEFQGGGPIGRFSGWD